MDFMGCWAYEKHVHISFVYPWFIFVNMFMLMEWFCNELVFGFFNYKFFFLLFTIIMNIYLNNLHRYFCLYNDQNDYIPE